MDASVIDPLKEEGEEAAAEKSADEAEEKAEAEAAEPGWEALDEDDDYVDRYGILFEDYRGPRFAAIFKSFDVFRMLVAGTSISILAGSDSAFFVWLQAALVFAVQVVQFILECVLRPESCIECIVHPGIIL